MIRLPLVLGALLLLSPVARADDWLPSPDPVENAARKDFSHRMGIFNRAGDWQALRDNGRAWQKLHPTDSNGWFTQARGAYFLGDMDEAIVAYRKSLEVEPTATDSVKFWMETAQAARRNFPNLQLKPLRFVEGDVVKEERKWAQKGAAMLAAKQFDEIEKTARELQHSKASSAKGTPFLSCFFDGLCGQKDALTARQSRVAAWRAARPQSALARLTSVQLWTDEAWNIRGTGTADTITQNRSERMSAALERAFKNLRAVPPTDFSTPLAFEVAMNWGQLSDVPRSFVDEMFQSGPQKFPDYLPFYRTYAYILMPRWFGKAGDSEALIEARANALGGDEGHIFYARLVWTQIRFYGEIWKETTFSYNRFKRGMELLARRKPDSLSVANALLRGATITNDRQTAKTFFASPRGYLVDSAWWTREQQLQLPDLRMQYLAS